MSSLPHRIRRLSLRAQACSSEAGLALRKQLRDLADTSLLPTLGAAFDASGVGDRLLHLPRIELRLRVGAAEDVTRELPRLIAEAVQQQLAQLPRAAAPKLAVPEAAAASTPHGEVGMLGAVHGQEREADPLEALVFYLETGCLAWPLANLEAGAALAALQLAAEVEPLAVLRRLARLPSDPRAASTLWFRWLQLVAPARWPSIVRSLAAPSGQADVWTEVALLLADERAPRVSTHVRLQLIAAVAARAASPSALPDDGGAVAALIQHALRAQHVERNQVALQLTARREIAAREFTALLPQPAAAWLGRWMSEASAAIRPSRSTAHARVEPDAPAPTAQGQGLATSETAARTHVPQNGPARPAEQRAPQPPEHARPARAAQPVTAGAPPSRPPLAASADWRSSAGARTQQLGRIVHYAGLVIVHPYLPRFFEATSIKAAGAPTLAPDVLPRAAALLHLLATGEEQVHELDLDFIKVLLGLTLETPLPLAQGLLDAPDREEVEALLSAVIRHWSALKRTSLAGLRGAFLQRRGLLRQQDNDWRLQLEAASFDLLIAQLPWSLGIIKLPWMKQAIITDWPQA